MTTPSVSRAAADRATSDPAPLVPTVTAADPPPVAPDRVTADHVTAREIVEFLRDLAELRARTRGEDPGERAAFLTRKAELFTRIGVDLPAPPAAERRTP